MEYADRVISGAMGASIGQRIERIEPSRPLDNIAHAVRRVDAVCEKLNAFLDRFHDAPKGDTATAYAGDELVATRIPHARSLERLNASLERLEALANGVESIG